MANYVKFTDFQAKDSLTTGDPLKIIKGQEINDEFNAIQTAVATKADLASPVLLGNPTAPTQALGNNSTRLSTTAFVQNAITANQASVAITGGTIDGVAITGGTVTGLATDLAVADGGTGKSTLALNNVILGNGTSAVQEVAPGTSGNVLTSNGTTWQSAAKPPSIGDGQTWQDLLSSRSAGVNYTNNTGRAIEVTVSGRSLAVAANFLELVVGGVIIERNGNSQAGGIWTSISGIIPNNTTYRVNSDNVGLEYWAELR